MTARSRPAARRPALLVLGAATVDVALAAGVVIGRVDPGYLVPMWAALAGVAVTVAVGLVTVLRGRMPTPRPVVAPAAAVPVVPVVSLAPVAAARPVDEYVDTLLADLSLT